MYGDTTISLEQTLQKSLLKHSVDMVCFRDKQTTDIKKLAQTVLDISRKNHISKVLINSHIDLAVELGFDGVHLTSLQFGEIQKAKKKNLFVIMSCHSEKEIKLAKEYGCDGVTYSPIFFKEDKGEPKGCEMLKNIVLSYQDKDFFILALGGITQKSHIQQIQNTKVAGFGAIRYFLG